KDLIDIISQKQNDKFNNNLVIQDTSIYTPLGKMGNILQGNTSINSYLVNQISEKIEFLVKGKDTQEAIIQLKPPSLGKINIQVTFERGVLTARIVTQNQEVKNIIESNLPLLKQNLADQGMGISNLSVSVNTGDSKGFEYYKDKRQTKTNLKRPNIKDVSGNSSAIKKYDDYLNIGYINYLV
ncbi:MAG: flagellar hook-length control protein FliK, partial [Clostridia bacterium]|nr:flagellar hook-length control protein FliK [Clostridia bacterium]